MRSIPHPRLQTNRSLREVLFEYFSWQTGGKELPIRGGWGYTAEDPIIIDRNDPVVDPALPFDGVGLEHFIAEKRARAELYAFPPPGVAETMIRIFFKSQEIRQSGGLMLDHLQYSVWFLLAEDYEEIRKGLGDENESFSKLLRSKHSYEAEYWFDITSFYGKDSLA